MADFGEFVDFDVEKYDDTGYLAVISIYVNRCPYLP